MPFSETMRQLGGMEAASAGLPGLTDSTSQSWLMFMPSPPSDRTIE